MVKLRMKWKWHLKRAGEIRNAYKAWVGNPQDYRPDDVGVDVMIILQ
jgi:hypothetical protein